MIRRALLVAAVLVGFGQAGYAITPLAIWVDPDGTAYLWNTTGAPISFDGYQLASETNRLDPAGWNSIADQVAADPLSVIGKLGAGALSFGEANPGAGNLAELNLGGVATLGGRTKFAIGKPFQDWSFSNGPPADFYYGRGGGDVVPEPSTFLLAAMAGVGLLAIRSRGFRSR